MSRSGYSDDCDGYPVELYRQAVHRATTGHRGQHLLKKLRDALDAMPVKRLITDAIKDRHGDVCALGALDPAAPDVEDDYEAAGRLGEHFGIARSLAAEIVYENDEAGKWRGTETPEARWVRMRAWVVAQIAPDAVAGGVDE